MVMYTEQFRSIDDEEVIDMVLCTLLAMVFTPCIAIW